MLVSALRKAAKRYVARYPKEKKDRVEALAWALDLPKDEAVFSGENAYERWEIHSIKLEYDEKEGIKVFCEVRDENKLTQW